MDRSASKRLPFDRGTTLYSFAFSAFHWAHPTCDYAFFAFRHTLASPRLPQLPFSMLTPCLRQHCLYLLRYHETESPNSARLDLFCTDESCVVLCGSWPIFPSVCATKSAGTVVATRPSPPSCPYCPFPSPDWYLDTKVLPDKLQAQYDRISQTYRSRDHSLAPDPVPLVPPQIVLFPLSIVLDVLDLVLTSTRWSAQARSYRSPPLT